MKQVLIQKGRAIVADVPAPKVGAGEVLVRVQTSCLSVGTEMNGVRASAVPLWKKALKQPEKIVETLQYATTLGLKRTWSLLEEKRDAAHATGYSATGFVVDVGADIQDIAIGERVACAGAQCAHHAEFIRVPRNLCVVLPEGLSFDNASTVTLGAIALQGVRRASPTLGECFAVIGLGILGQLTVQLLKANGCRAIGIDVSRDRIALALELGMSLGLHPDDAGFEHVARLTNGLGVDGVIITAATPSDTVVSSAFRLCRKKGRVVLVGDVGLHLNRADFYVKEIDFLISSSYGPGRYDHRYEEQGLDYPVAYVRWTENRNMSEYLRLLAEKRVQVDPLISARYPIHAAEEAYTSLTDAAVKPMMVLLTYPVSDGLPQSTLHLKQRGVATPGRVRVAVVGAGTFARSAHLPNLQCLSERFILQAVVTRTGHSAAAIAKQFGAVYCGTDFDAVLNDPEVDAVIIATRHHQHGEMALAALKAGKHVLVEKPLVLNADELMALDYHISLHQDKPLPVLLTGYNRRFSPYARRMAEILQHRTGPLILNYRMNAGYIPSEHWVHGPEGGGRNLGEACHIYDLFTFLVNADVVDVHAAAIRPLSPYDHAHDNFIATLTFAEGSVASLTYTAMGAKDYPKEMADIYVDGKLMVLSDYKSFDVYGMKRKSLKTAVQEKGLREELIAFSDAIQGGDWPIPWWQQMQAAKISLLVEDQI